MTHADLRTFAIPFACALALASCSSHRLDDEPADLVASSPAGAERTVAEWSRAGWEIGAPIDPTASGLPDPDDGSPVHDGKTWRAFVAQLAPGDELRPVRLNAGIGYAIFRNARLVDVYLVTIF